ncbi:hypothetical protein G9A89_012692 [Geosiphon pyriformis]|nr:hypothetical protein G9A89_012692 [Geosiphon pyriformis]
MPECVHDTNARFDLRYPGKDAIKLEPHLCTCINLKVVLEIPATTMVQLASRSSLAKKRINIKGGIIDAEYVETIIAILQNDSEKTYIIEPNKKITQAIFLPLVKIAQLVLMENRKKLGITARGIQGFGSTDYWKLNKVTKGNNYPTPKIQELFNAFCRKKWFLTLDLDSGYWQVTIKPEDK